MNKIVVFYPIVKAALLAMSQNSEFLHDMARLYDFYLNRKAAS